MNRRNFATLLLPVANAGGLAAGGSEPVVHPVFRSAAAAGQVGSLRSRLRALLALDEPRLLVLIPTRSGFIACDCPNCDQGAQGSQLEWSIEEPTILTCRYCGERYPSRKYPDDKVLEVRNPLGRIEQYPYYQDSSGRRHFFQARLWRLTRNYFMLAAYDLAQLYHHARDRQYARRAALILDRFAELYPGFLVTREPSQEDQGFQERPPYHPQGGKWGRWYYDEMPTPLIRAYDLVYNSGELDALSRERGVDLKRRIEQDFFRAAVRHVRTYPEFHANPSPRIYEGLAVLGRVIGEPDYVHDAVRRMKGLFHKRFFFDGMWKEGTFGYHEMTMRGIEAALNAVRGYSDPPGYTDPSDGRRFDRLDPEAEIPTLARARKATERLRYPDGRPLPVHDSWARVRGAYLKGEPLAASSPALWPAMGHAYLGRGRGAGQIQAHLHFGGGYGHAHNDSLNLALFAGGEELLPDLGYTHTRYRSWTRSTLAHNTVVVNGVEQHSGSEEKPSDGNLLLFLAAGDAFQIVEASGERAYPGHVRTYSRTVMLVGIDERNAYVVDLFRVEGGRRHEWMLHGSADRDQNLSVVGQALSPAMFLPPGVEFKPPTNEYETGAAGGHNPAYGFLRDVRRGRAPEALLAVFEPSLRVHCLPPAGAEIFTCRAPSIRCADENDARVDQFWAPMLVLRKEGEDLAESYVSVMEPFRDSALIRGVEKRGDAVVVTGDGWTDHIVYRSESGEVICGPLRLNGRAGWVREREGKPVAMCLAGGTELSFANRRLTSFGTLAGRVTGVLRKAAGHAIDALQVDGEFPRGAALAGLTAIVRHGDGSTYGYVLRGLRRERGRTLLLLPDEPGFETDRQGRSRFLFFPQREIQGGVTYSIAALAYL